MSIQTSEIQLKVNDKTVNAYLAAPQNGGPGVLVLHAWWGLKPFFKQVCDQLAEQGFTAFAPDLYQGRVAKTIDEAKEFMEQNDFEFMSEIVKAANAHLTSLCAGKIGVIGFSMGSGWALAVAERNPDVSAAVLFYGAGEADFSKVKAKVLGHFAEVDEWEPLEYVQGMEAGMKSAGLDVTLHTYPKVAHWFVEEDRPEYDSASAQLAWSRTYEFLRKNL
ncbi:MAG: dienelactone hydrolase family protein [Anaerolineales bacterium]|nr:dienelactone hydrolase family protein [Anaerolineales bacterium]